MRDHDFRQIEEIRQILNRYARAVDAHDWDLYRSGETAKELVISPHTVITHAYDKWYPHSARKSDRAVSR